MGDTEREDELLPETPEALEPLPDIPEEPVDEAGAEGGDDEDARVDPEGDDGDGAGDGEAVATASDEPEGRDLVDEPGGAVAETERRAFVDLAADLLSRLRVLDTFDGQPQESWNYVDAALKRVEEGDEFVPSKVAFDLHRLYFPYLGERRMKAASRLAQAGKPPVPLAGHVHFTEALQQMVVGDNTGPALMESKYEAMGVPQHGDNVIGLARCIVPGLLGVDQHGIMAGKGCDIAGLTHLRLGSRNWGGFLSLLAYFWLRNGGDVRAALDGMDGIEKVASTVEAVRMGEMDATGLPITEYVSFKQAATAFGAYYLGRRSASRLPPWMKGPLARALRPTLGLFGAPELDIPPELRLDMKARLSVLIEKGSVAP